jgi:hypothetical protein
MNVASNPLRNGPSLRLILSLTLFVALLIATSSCRVINTLTGNDPNLKKVGDLWSDVPRMDGLTSSEADMPVFVRLMMRTALNNLYRLNKEGEDKTPAKGDWAVFSTTKSADEVKNFYTNDRMTSFGNWEASKNSTCVDGKDQGFSGVACVFNKVQNNLGTGLLIVAVPHEQKKQTEVFFVRVESPETTSTNTNHNKR